MASTILKSVSTKPNKHHLLCYGIGPMAILVDDWCAPSCRKGWWLKAQGWLSSALPEDRGVGAETGRCGPSPQFRTLWLPVGCTSQPPSRVPLCAAPPCPEPSRTHPRADLSLRASLLEPNQ